MSEIDMASFAGLAFVVSLIVEGLKKAFAATMEKYQKPACIVLAFALGIIVKLTVPGAYESASWPNACLGFLGAGFGAMGVYSGLIKPLKGAGGAAVKAMLIGTTALMLLPGCAIFQRPDKQLVSGVEGYTDVILPEYEAYVEADARLNQNDKQIRKNSSAGLKRLLDEAKR